MDRGPGCCGSDARFDWAWSRGYVARAALRRIVHHTSRITRHEPPRYFQDAMVRGLFRSFRHDHYFESDGQGTEMRDRMEFVAPLGVLGISQNVWLLSGTCGGCWRRNACIRRVAESDEGKSFLP